MATFTIKDNSSKPYAHMLDGVDLNGIEDVSKYVGDYVETAIAATNYSENDDYTVFSEWLFTGELEEAIAYIQSRINEEKAEAVQQPRIIEALELSDWSDIEAVPEIDEEMPFNDNGGDPDGNAWILADYTAAQKVTLMKNGADVVKVMVVEYSKDDEQDDYMLSLPSGKVSRDDFKGRWMGMQIEKIAYIIVN